MAATRKILAWTDISRDYKKGMKPTQLAIKYNTTPATISVHMTRSGLANKEKAKSALVSKAVAIAATAVEQVITHEAESKCLSHLAELDLVKPQEGHTADSLEQAVNTTHTIVKTAAQLYRWNSSQSHPATVNIALLCSNNLPSPASIKPVEAIDNPDLASDKPSKAVIEVAVTPDPAQSSPSLAQSSPSPVQPSPALAQPEASGTFQVLPPDNP